MLLEDSRLWDAPEVDGERGKRVVVGWTQRREGRG